MGLLAALGTAKAEEDVKDAYIKALGLKQYRWTKNGVRVDFSGTVGAGFTENQQSKTGSGSLTPSCLPTKGDGGN